MAIGLALAILKHRYRTIADKVIQPIDGGLDDRLVITLHATGEQGIGRAGNEETIEDQFRSLMKQQVAMEVEIGRKQFAPEQPDGTRCLLAIAETPLVLAAELAGPRTTNP